MFESRQIGTLAVSAIGVGGAHWSLWADNDEAASIAAINAAIDSGVTMIDTAYRYTYPGAEQHNEELIARALRLRGWKSDVDPAQIVIATKGGHFGYGEQGYVDGRPTTLRRHCISSLMVLGVEQIPLYYLHWPDPKVPVEESLEGLAELQAEGMIANIGVSNFNLDQLKRVLPVAKVVAVQNKFNLGHQEDRELIAFCREQGIAYVPYSPLGGTFPPTAVLADQPRLAALAEEAGVSVPVLVLNWLLNLSDNIIPLVGSRRPESILDSARVLNWPISTEIVRKVSEICTI